MHGRDLAAVGGNAPDDLAHDLVAPHQRRDVGRVREEAGVEAGGGVRVRGGDVDETAARGVEGDDGGGDVLAFCEVGEFVVANESGVFLLEVR